MGAQRRLSGSLEFQHRFHPELHGAGQTPLLIALERFEQYRAVHPLQRTVHPAAPPRCAQCAEAAGPPQRATADLQISFRLAGSGFLGAPAQALLQLLSTLFGFHLVQAIEQSMQVAASQFAIGLPFHGSGF